VVLETKSGIFIVTPDQPAAFAREAEQWGTG